MSASSIFRGARAAGSLALAVCQRELSERLLADKPPSTRSITPQIHPLLGNGAETFHGPRKVAGRLPATDGLAARAPRNLKSLDTNSPCHLIKHADPARRQFCRHCREGAARSGNFR